MSGRGGGSGQALIETAITLPIMIVLFLGFLAVGLAVQGAVDLNTAVYLAAASNATAYANTQNGDADQFALDTFDATVRHDSLLQKKSFACAGNYAAGGQIHCDGTATLLYSRTPMAIVVPIPDPDISATAFAVRSKYRSEKP